MRADSDRHTWIEQVRSPYVLVAFLLGCVLGFYGASAGGVVIGRPNVGDFSRVMQEGKALEYHWVMRPADPPGAKTAEGKMIQSLTGKKEMIDGKEFAQMQYHYEGIPLPSGAYFLRATRESIEQTQASIDGSGIDAPTEVTTLAQLPLEQGREWSFLGPSRAKVTRFADYRDASGVIHKDAACVVVSLGTEIKSEYWLHPDVGVLAMKIFAPSIGGEMEWQYIGAREMP